MYYLLLATKLLQNALSAIENIFCSNINCINTDKQISIPSIILGFKSNGFNSIQEQLEKYVATRKYDCDKCTGNIYSNRLLLQHKFIDTDVYASNNLFGFKNFLTN